MQHLGLDIGEHDIRRRHPDSKAKVLGHPSTEPLVAIGLEAVVREVAGPGRIPRACNKVEFSYEQRSERPTQRGRSGSAGCEVCSDISGRKARLGLADVERPIIRRRAQPELQPDRLVAVESIEPGRCRHGHRCVFSSQPGTSERTNCFLSMNHHEGPR